MVHNDLLIAARRSTPSPRTPGECLSRAELSRAVNTWLAQNTGEPGALDAHYVGRLERGHVRWPGRNYRAALRAILHVNSDEDLGFHPPRRAGHQLSVAVDPAGALAADDSDRVAAALTRGHTTDQDALSAVEAVLSSVRRLEDRTSAAAVLPTVLSQRDVAEGLARSARGPVLPAAVGLASEVHQYLGWLHLPQGFFGAAVRHLDRAASLALEADDPVRLAAALSFQAHAHQRNGDWQRAGALVSAAARDGRVYPGVRTYLHYQRAEILAQQGERQRSSHVLVRADALVEQLPPADELPESGYWYIPAFFLGERASVLSALGDTTAAHESATACLAELPTAWRHTEWATERHPPADP